MCTVTQTSKIYISVQYNILGLAVTSSSWQVKQIFRDRDGLRKVALLATHPPDVAASSRIFH